ncbi:DUF5675 family protein [Campylobacter pinnipediorum]|uniref:DUF5675 family protein n=1 Tax=Campylobacter pinnipediorum TaxID=1965231 RepID=UPI000995754B|nr:DUF5675 family protein [Campylobacter pinnipediorum]AQW82985.1 hypothetical protein CPIN17261_0981 [Campylobacter pinnipediorum subsp. pinnipediorum]
MILHIMRIKDINDGSIGEFELKNSDDEIMLNGYTLEPAGPDTIERNKDKRIPKGLYHVSWHSSPKFKTTLPLLHNENVAKDRFVLIHAGNYLKDTKGCILLGASYDDKGVYKSKDTLNKFLKLTRCKELKVVISDVR